MILTHCRLNLEDPLARAESRDLASLHLRVVDAAQGIPPPEGGRLLWSHPRPGIVGVSWGKDSTVVAHLAAEHLPLVWARADRRENPDCERVRDAFLAAHPTARYEEHTYTWRAPLPGEPGWDATQPGQDALSDTIGHLHGGRRITGVRAQESSKRRLSAATHGTATARSCRPILRWTHHDVFAYLHRHDLPVHPAYAMTYGGAIDRSRPRVHALGTVVGDRAWEKAYYGEVT